MSHPIYMHHLWLSFELWNMEDNRKLHNFLLFFDFCTNPVQRSAAFTKAKLKLELTTLIANQMEKNNLVPDMMSEKRTVSDASDVL